eukprot:jgi/Mesen1/8361/ME000464S07763
MPLSPRNSLLTPMEAPFPGDRLLGSIAVPQFPPAAQPEVMRAAEKDEQYLASICEACYDVSRRYLGTRAAVAFQNETKLAGRVLYYLLTTGAGLQTLGEEYCDIRQVAGYPAVGPSATRRSLLIIFHAVLPYLAQRAR